MECTIAQTQCAPVKQVNFSDFLQEVFEKFVEVTRFIFVYLGYLASETGASCELRRLGDDCDDVIDCELATCCTLLSGMVGHGLLDILFSFLPVYLFRLLLLLLLFLFRSCWSRDCMFEPDWKSEE